MDNHQFDRDEFKESYAHYRHLEEERSRHLRFFLVMAGALLGLLGFLAKDGLPVTDRDGLLFVCGLVMVLLQALDILTFMTIRRVGDARAQHGKIIKHIRGRLTSDKYVADLWADFRCRRGVSVQVTIQLTLHLLIVVFVLIALFFALKPEIVVCWMGDVVFGLTMFFLLMHIIVCAWLKVPKEEQSNNGVNCRTEQPRCRHPFRISLHPVANPRPQAR